MASGMEGIVQFKYKVGPIAENRRAFIQMGSSTVNGGLRSDVYIGDCGICICCIDLERGPFTT